MNWEDLLDRVGNKINEWAHGAASLLPNLVVALLVVLAAYLVARVVSTIVERSLGRVSSNSQATSLLAQLVRIAILAGGLFVALGVLQLDGTVKSLLAGVGVIGLALGFAFQDIASNFVSGVILAFRRQFDRGDLIEAAEFFGIVEDVNLRVTIGRTFQGQKVIIPNKEIFNSKITNYYSNKERRVDFDVGVSYGDDLELARKVTLDAVRRVKERDQSRDVEVFFKGFGSSSIDMTVRFWVDPQQKAYLSARSEAIVAIKKAYDANGITIPFPIRTLDFGIVGGMPLGEALQNGAEKDAA